MLFGSSFFSSLSDTTNLLYKLPAPLELTVPRINHQKSAVRLCCASDHVCNEITMAWRIQNGEVTVGRLEMSCCHLDGHSTLLLLLRLIHHVGESEAVLIVLFSFALVRSEHLARDDAVFEENLTGKRAFTAINMADNDQV